MGDLKWRKIAKKNDPKNGQNTLKWPKMNQNGPKWPKMAQNGPQCLGK